MAIIQIFYKVVWRAYDYEAIITHLNRHKSSSNYCIFESYPRIIVFQISVINLVKFHESSTNIDNSRKTNRHI